MKKHSISYILGIAWLFLPLLSYSQSRPYINSIDPVVASAGATLTIVGSGFPTSTANLIVSFGGVKGTPLTSTENLITVTIPAGARYAEVMVTDLSSGLSASSREYFQLTYGGDSFSSQSDVNSAWDTVVDIPTGTTASESKQRVFDVCACDLDGDGLQDAIVSSSQNGPSSNRSKRVVLRNTSTLTTTSYALDEELNNQPSKNVQCKDLNGDGKPDLVVSEIVDESFGDTGSEDLEVYINTTTGPGDITFDVDTLNLIIPRDGNGNVRPPARIEIADVDLDGKNDIISSNELNSTLDIFLNTTSGSSLSFASSNTSVGISSSSESFRAFMVGDLNKDGLPDIVAGEAGGTNFYFFENESTTGSPRFKDGVLVVISGQLQIQNIELADLNGDGLSEIILTDGDVGINSELIIARNTTSSAGAAITFGDIARFDTEQGPWGIDAGDIDGDGDVDLALAIITQPAQASDSKMDIMINSSTSSTFNFTKYTLSTNNNTRNTRIVDINGDARPDILATTNSRTDQRGSLAVFANRNCISPTLTPSTGVYCPGNEFTVSAPKALHTTYTFQVSVDGGAFTTKQTGSSNTYDISGETASSVAVKVTMNGDDGNCNNTSSAVTYTRNTVTPSSPPIVTDPTICVGETLNLSTSVTVDEYLWTGPNGFTSTESAPSITNAQAVHAGAYTLQVKNTGGCYSSITTSTVIVEALPDPNFANTGEDAFCTGNTTVLEATDFPGYSRKWNLNGSEITGQTGTTLTVSESGNYSLTLIEDSNSDCKVTSNSITLTKVDPPIPTINGTNKTCTDVEYVSESTIQGSAQYGFTYSWDIKDNSNNSLLTATADTVAYTYTSQGTYTATLTAGYEDVSSCTNQVTESILALDPVSIPITSATTQKCSYDSILLQMPDSLVSYTWSTNETSQDIYAKTNTSQNEVTISVTVLSSIGCETTSDITISNFPDSVYITSANSEISIVDGTLTIPASIISLQLQANGGSDYMWSPADIFDNPESDLVIARPKSVSTNIILSGLGANNCEVSDTLVLVNDNVQARGSFSPNDDEFGYNCWEILNTSTIEGCTLYILDARGRTIYQADSPFENNCAWEGLDSNGKQAPEGIYYFVMKCEDSQLDRSGSILLGR